MRGERPRQALREGAGTAAEPLPEPPIVVAPKVATRQAETVAYGYEPTFAPRMAQMSEQTNDWSMLSDDVVKMLDQIGARGRVKMEEIAA